MIIPTLEYFAAIRILQSPLFAERTADLQRVQAEYANYRKRAERERLAVGELAVGRVLADFLPVLDDLDRARAHGDLNGPLKAIADKLDDIVGKLGLQAFGEDGDPGRVAEQAAALAEAGLDLGIVYLPVPHTPKVLEPLAAALTPLT